MRAGQVESVLAHLLCAERRGDAGDGRQLDAGTVLDRLRQRISTCRLDRYHGHLAQPIAVQACHDTGEQAAAAHGQHNAVELDPGAHRLIDHCRVALPHGLVVERMHECGVVIELRQRERIGLLPGGAMHDNCGTFLFNQLLGACGRGFRHVDRHRDAKLTTAIGDRNSGIAAGRGNESLLALAHMGFAKGTYTAKLERARGLQRIQLHPDVFGAQQAERLRSDKRGFNVEWHGRSWARWARFVGGDLAC